MLSPQGRRLDQAVVEELAGERRLLLLCGRYEGFDERVKHILQPDEISIGDFVLNGGEVAAMVVIDAVIRLVPGVLGDEQSSREDSFSGQERLLEFSQYTRPREYRGYEVPEILLSGDHGRQSPSGEPTSGSGERCSDQNQPQRCRNRPTEANAKTIQHPPVPSRRRRRRRADQTLRKQHVERTTDMSQQTLALVEKASLRERSARSSRSATPSTCIRAFWKATRNASRSSTAW